MIPDRPEPPDLGECPDDWENECVINELSPERWIVKPNCDCPKAEELREERNR